MEARKWTKEQLTILISAYRNESCLYAVKSSNYHNKNLRNAALERIGSAVNQVRPGTDVKECQSKVYNLRTQFNVENAKRRASLKSGAGTDDVYTPSLWYYDLLLFLEEHIVPRKSISSMKSSQVNRVSSEDVGQCSAVLVEETFAIDDSTHESGEFTFPMEFDQEVVIASSPLCSPEVTSLASTSGASSTGETSSRKRECHISTVSGTLSSSSNARRRKKESEDQYVGAVAAIAKVLSTPEPQKVEGKNPVCPVDSCILFIGSLLKEFTSEQLKLEVMNTLVQTVISSRAQDLQ